MKSLIDLFLHLYTDVYGLSGADTDTRDIDYITRRVEKEGLSFLTITLPTFGKALERALEEGRWTPDLASSFRKRPKSSLPAFLQGLMSLIFTQEGDLRDDSTSTAVWGVRQLSYFCKKVQVPCSEERTRKAYLKYLSTDAEVKPFRDIPLVDANNICKTFDILFGHALRQVDYKIYEGLLIPRHGRGAVAEKLKGNQKFHMQWYNRLSYSFPPELYLSPNLGADGSLELKKFIRVGGELPARVVHVPKTLKTPRLIAIEPACIQYTQQSLMLSLYTTLLNSSVGQCLNFTDQSINASIALRGSRTRRSATLDLSEASDRVSAGLVSALLRNFPHLRRAMFSARSNRVSLNYLGSNFVNLRIKKFASMGSAVCFPIEAMVFLAITTYAILLQQGKSLVPRHVKAACRRVTVFGDDITLPSDYAPSAIVALEHFGLRVNRDKSFYKGSFRESCGTDAYKGDVITPIYVTQSLPTTRDDAVELMAGTSLCNRLFAGGMWKAAHYVQKQLEKCLKTTLPVVLETSPALGLVSPWSAYYDKTKYCSVLHRPLVLAWTANAVKQSDELDGYEALLKLFLRKGESSEYGSLSRDREVTFGTSKLWNLYDTIIDGGLNVTTKSGAFTIKRRWCVPY